MAQETSYRKESGRMYEISFVSNSKEAEDKAFSVIRDSGAELTYHYPAVSVTFAYPIKKHSSGHFGFFQFRSTPSVLARVKEGLTANKDILRFLVVKDPILKSGAQEREKKEESPRESGERPLEPHAEPLTNEALEAKLEEILK